MKTRHILTSLLAILCCTSGISAAFLLNVTDTPRAYAESNSYARVVHASPDIGTADVFVDGNKLLGNFQFGTVTDYVQLPAGTHTIKVALIGKGPDAATITQDVEVQAGVVYTIAALGTASQGFSLHIFIDNNQVAKGSSKVRVYHLSPGAGTVSVSNGNSTLINGLGYSQASDYLSVPAGDYKFDVKISQNNTDLPLQTKLDPDTVTSVFAVGRPDGTPKLQFVTAKANGMPGMPSTGSDPNYHPANGIVGSMADWLPETLILFILICGAALGRRAFARRRA